MNNREYKLNDDVIAQIRYALQLCMLTGTDFVDHVRMFRMQSDLDGNLSLTNEYVEQQKAVVADLEKKAAELSNQSE